ncbi:MAG: autotransporter outer membrane beta-barrel domain-containing protein, partial [Deltaproteobacteria bacterium]|jgi:hypothetical protein|nr:autotransporter outer membrane beta-barrel domain-containing protein [Deltaproteobacteria bacterium]
VNFLTKLPVFTSLSSRDGNTVTLKDELPHFVVGGLFDSKDDGITGSVSGNKVLAQFADKVQVSSLYGGLSGAGSGPYVGNERVNGVSLSSLGNAVLVKNADVRMNSEGVEVFGGSVQIFGHGSAAASGNTVVFVASQAKNVYGGHVYFDVCRGDEAGCPTRSGHADDNEVIVKDSQLELSIFGGYAQNAVETTAVRNKVTLIGDVRATTVRGGRIVGAQNAQADDFSGNILQVVSPAAGGVQLSETLGNFERYRFLLDPAAASGSTVIQAKTVELWDKVSRSSVIESIDFLNGDVPSVGYSVVLMEAETVEHNFNQSAVAGRSGVNLLMDFGLALTASDKSRLTATLRSVRSNPQMESLSESRSAGLSFVSQGFDVISSELLNSTLSTHLLTPCPAAFFAARAGRNSVGRSGSRYDVDSYMGLMGLNCTSFLESGALTMGGFVEMATGDFETTTRLTDRQLRGKGDLRRLGLGATARFEFDSNDPLAFYLDASVRGGRLHQDFTSDDFQNSQNQAKMDVSSMYAAGHLGVGGYYALANGNVADVYARYAYTYLQGSRAIVDLNTPVEFEPAVSHLARVGGRYAFNIAEKFRLQAGLGYEYEFGGRIKSSTQGYRIKTIDLMGGSALGELTLTYLRPGPNPLSFMIGAEGFMGRRRAFVGSLKLSLSF